MASRFASRRPAGLSKLILSNSAASKAASLANRWIYRREMSEEHQEILECNEKAGTTGSEEYGRVMAMFTKEHICNVESPEDWDVSAKFAREDDTVAKDMFVFPLSFPFSPFPFPSHPPISLTSLGATTPSGSPPATCKPGTPVKNQRISTYLSS